MVAAVREMVQEGAGLTQAEYRAALVQRAHWRTMHDELARRSGDTWYLAAINGEAEAKDVVIPMRCSGRSAGPGRGRLGTWPVELGLSTRPRPSSS